MELTSKQRAQLRSLASTLDTIIHIGKDAGRRKEGTVYDLPILLGILAAAEELKPRTRSEVVQVIGNKFVLYRMQHDKTKRRIELVKAPRRSV